MSGSLKRSTAKMTMIVMVATVLSRGIGFLREVVLGSTLGTTYVADAYSMALSVPNILFSNIVGAIGVAFIPIYVSIQKQSGEEKAKAFSYNVFYAVIIVGVLLSVITLLAAHPILSVVAYAFDEKTMRIAVDVSRVIFFSFVFMGVNAVLTGYLNANNRFFATNAISIPFSVIVIAALFLYDRMGIQGLAYATLLGMISQTVILLINAFVIGFRPKFVFDIKNPALISMLILAMPTFVSSSVGEINVLVNRTLASGLPEGSIAALNYSDKLNQAICAITATAISIVIYPRLSKLSAGKDSETFKNLLVKGINITTILLLPATVAIVILNKPIVQLLLERGAFDTRSTEITASALMYYALGLIFLGYRSILLRAFYSLKDTKTPMINGFFAVAINVILNLVLIRFMAHNGLALATTITMAITTIPLMYSLRKKMGNIGGKKILAAFVKSGISATVMGVVVFMTHELLRALFPDAEILLNVIILGILAIEGITFYLGLIAIMKAEELNWIIKLARFQKVSKKYKR